MRKIIKNRHAALNLPSLRLECNLFLPDQLEKAALGTASKQSEADYNTPKGLKLKDDYSRAFQIACAQWKHFAAQMERADVDAFVVTSNFVQELLRDALGYTNLTDSPGISAGGRHYPINYIAGSIPVVIAPHNLSLDEPVPLFAPVHEEGGGSRKKSAFQLAQELLNASPDHLWALASNGKQIRLLRDAASLTRPSFLEIDLQDLLGGQRFAEFAIAWRLLHASRAGNTSANCVWESWREIGQVEGTRVRDGLRLGVTQALLTLGEGFVAHPANSPLRLALQDGELSKEEYFRQLLRLIYRFIFLFNVEERGILHSPDDSKEAIAARRAYAEGYALSRLRDLSLKRRARSRFDDVWQSLRIVFRGLSHGEPRLALPALGGLFASSQCPVLDSASLSNVHLLSAMQQLRWANQNGTLAPIDYRNMGPEELGSVYESLLELVPEVDIHARTFGFVGLTSEGSTAGNARKLSGSYYTPDSLVQELIKSALDPVIEQRIQTNAANPIEALLTIRVIDPACGSGHFLLAAARRLAERLAQLRAPEGAVKPQDYRHALREVISRCIFGVDRNPMALELARTALWLEGYEEGRPLGFLNHHLQCGDALLGVINLKDLERGIAKDAFKALSGDDKEVCKALAKTNSAGLKQLERDLHRHQVLFQFDEASGLQALSALEALPENSPEDIVVREAAYRSFLEQAKTSRLHHAADLLIGAYLLTKTEATKNSIPTSTTLYLELLSDSRSQEHQLQLAAAQAACVEARVFHWPMAFPQVFAAGGFDCVLGNPPWERIKLQEEEFFATRHPRIAEAKNKAERSQRIQWLSEGMLAKHLYPELEHPEHECEAEKHLYAEFITSRRTAEAASVFAHVKGDDGGRYPLTGVGDVNTYALFSETIRQVVAPQGRAGFIVPSGLATDNTTKDFFGDLITKNSLESFFEFENEGFFAGAGQGHMLRFALTTIVGIQNQANVASFLFQGKNLDELYDPERVFTLTAEEIFQVNPNTKTCPIFRSRMDAEITRSIYARVPVLMREAESVKDEVGHNPWEIRFLAMFHMSNESYLFKTKMDLVNEGYELHGNNYIHGDIRFVPLYEAKMIQIYNHRHGDFSDSSNDERSHVLPTIPVSRLKDPQYLTQPYYWVPQEEVDKQLDEKCWNHNWLIGWREVTDARASKRTLIASVIPRAGINNKFLLILPNKSPEYAAALLGNLNSLVCDYVTRQKVGGLALNYFTLKQLPILEPENYTKLDLKFIVTRVLELTYTAIDLAGWANDLGYTGEPFEFDSDRRALLRAELDAYYAVLYGLSRGELSFILDPKSDNPSYPSETFSVLKRSEIREFSEYRTQRLVLEAWDKLERGELN